MGSLGCDIGAYARKPPRTSRSIGCGPRHATYPPVTLALDGIGVIPTVRAPLSGVRWLGPMHVCRNISKRRSECLHARHNIPPAARVWGAWPSQRNVCRINHSALLRAVWSRSAVRRSLACPIGYLARSVSRFCAARCWAASRRAVLQLPPSLSPAEGCAYHALARSRRSLAARSLVFDSHPGLGSVRARNSPGCVVAWPHGSSPAIFLCADA